MLVGSGVTTGPRVAGEERVIVELRMIGVTDLVSSRVPVGVQVKVDPPVLVNVC